MIKINKISALEILDSRGEPTIEVFLFSSDGLMGKAAVPSGKSSGVHEAFELRDNDKKRYFGKGVLKAIDGLKKRIEPEILKKSFNNQKEFDDFLVNIDGTRNKSDIGANTLLGASLAFARLSAVSEKKPLWKYISEISGCNPKAPKIFFNVINGGLHAGNNLDIQEHMIVPQKESLAENIRIAAEFYHQLKLILEKKYGKSSTALGDEGGFVPLFEKYTDPFDSMIEAAQSSGHENDILFASDIAASSFYNNGKYVFSGKNMLANDLFNIYDNLIKKYPFFSIEDPFAEDDFKNFSLFLDKYGKNIWVVGDDLTVTNPERIKMAEENKSCNTLLLKVNQIGTLSEALFAASIARSFGWKIMVSHRSGETEDSFISDLAFGIGSDAIKSGAPARGERTSKYNRFIEIENNL